MKCAYLILLKLLLLTSFSNAEPLTPDVNNRIRTITLEGLNKAYNFDFVTANKTFDTAAGVEPLHPRPHVGKAMIELWRYLLGKNDSAKESFLKLAENAIEAAEEYEDRFGEDAESKLCLGTIYGYRAFVNGRAKSYFKAAWDGKKSYDYYVDALQLDPRTYDAYLGIGIFHYFMDFLPKPLRWVASLIGIAGDARTGLKEIRTAAEKGVYTRVEAQYYLAQFAPWMDGEFDRGEKILTDLSKQYPSNTLFAFTLAVWEIRRNDVRSARDQLMPLVEARGNTIDGIRFYAKYKLAECFFRLNMYTEAREKYQSFLQEYRDEMYRATANYRIGVCFELMGRRDSAMTYYQKVSRNDRRFGDDTYSSRKAAVRLKSPVAIADSFLIVAQNALYSGDYDGTLRIASQLASMPGISSDMIAEAEFLMAESHFEKKSYDEALPVYRSIRRLKTDGEPWLTPWSHYQSGLCLLKLNDPAAAREEFELSLEFEDYDFHNWLEFRAKREIEKIENKTNR